MVLLASDLVEEFLAAGCQRPPFRLALLFVLVCGAQTKVRMYMIDGCTMMKRKCINNITTQRSERGPRQLRITGFKLTPAPYEKAQTSEEMIYMQAVRSSRQLSTEVLHAHECVVSE